MNIIEKLGIKELNCIPCNNIKPSEACDYTAVLHEPLKERERVFLELLVRLIESCLYYEREYQNHGLRACDGYQLKQNISTIQKATGKTWEEIKEIINE